MQTIWILLIVIVQIGYAITCSPEANHKMYQFSVNIFSKIASKNTNENFAIAPSSIWANLMLLTKGATGETLTELLKLQSPKKKCRRKFYKRMVDRTKIEAYNLVSLRCAAFITDSNMTLDYITKVRLDNGVLLISVKKEYLNAAVQASNTLISTATRQIVKDAVTPSFLNHSSVRVLDVNVFKATFQIPLSEHSTVESAFNNEDGLYIGQTKMMNKTGKFRLAGLRLGCVVVEIPVPSASDLKILVFLPHRGTKVSAIVNRLKNEKIDDILNVLRRSKTRKITIMLPRFKVKSNISINEHLQGLGISKMFDPERAEFSSMGDAGYHVSQINHYSEAELREEDVDHIEEPSTENVGTLTFKVDRPFAFVVLQVSSEMLVYAGVFRDPSGSYFI